MDIPLMFYLFSSGILPHLLRKMAAEEQIAYWSMYDAMGGKDSMVRWVENGLAGSDYVHFTRSGANNIGKKLYYWLMSYSTSDRSQSSL